MSKDLIFLSLEAIDNVIYTNVLALIGNETEDTEVVLYCHPDDFDVISSLESFEGFEGESEGTLEWNEEGSITSVVVEQNEGCIPFIIMLKKIAYRNWFQILDLEEAGLNYEIVDDSESDEDEEEDDEDYEDYEDDDDEDEDEDDE